MLKKVVQATILRDIRGKITWAKVTITHNTGTRKVSRVYYGERHAERIMRYYKACDHGTPAKPKVHQTSEGIRVQFDIVTSSKTYVK